jgi:predicted acylesterase/phospholipase RssA/CheY-like chemotaxis protein
MNILIVDDSNIKIKKIKTVINETHIDSDFLIAQNKADAMSLIISNESIDLMILDLNLPNRNGEEPKRLAGLSLLKELNRRSSISKPRHIIGLTAYVELQNETVGEFVENGWIIITYDNSLSDWETTIKNKVEYIHNNKIHKSNSSDNDLALIMKGGGIKGLAYVGAIEELEKHFKFSWYAGTSAGAISAILLASGYNYKELKTILSEKNFNDFKDTWFLKGLINLILKGGFYEARSFNNWIDQLLAKKLGKATEVKLKSLPYRASIYASTQGKKALVFDSKDIRTNDIGAGFAARCSMSIPYVFVPQKNYGFNVFDGGMQNNYPVDILLEENPKTKFIGLYLGPEFYEGKKKRTIFW